MSFERRVLELIRERLERRGKFDALIELQLRRAHPPEQVDNAALYAGSQMYYYCHSCKHLADVLPECHTERPRQLCNFCQVMKDLGWLEPLFTSAA